MMETEKIQLTNTEIAKIVLNWYERFTDSKVSFHSETHIELDGILKYDINEDSEIDINDNEIINELKLDGLSVFQYVLYWYENIYKQDIELFFEDGIIESQDGLELNTYCKVQIKELTHKNN